MANLVHTKEGLDRRFYELCVLSELKNSLRSGDIWVQGSRQFKDFEGYLMPATRFSDLRSKGAVGGECEDYLQTRLALLEKRLAAVETLAAANELPDTTITSSGRLKITPLENGCRTPQKRWCSKFMACCPASKLPNCCWRLMVGLILRVISRTSKITGLPKTVTCS